MHSDTFLQGLSRVLNCSKVHVAVTGLASTWLAVRYATSDLPAVQRQGLWIAFIAAVAVQLREIINAWTEEDVVRVQQESRVNDRGSEPATASIVSDSVEGLPNTSTITRSPIMPPRTRLPLVLIACSMTACFTTGCQTPPELAVYREGLHEVDEPLYQAHLLLMDDAVKANLRTDADRQVVQQGITAARDVVPTIADHRGGGESGERRGSHE